MERFYDVERGSILIDGKEIKDYNLGWLRSKIGLVSQEPILFNCSIADNIRWGKEDATDEEIVNAAKMANAHQFISEFENQYETQVGERGTLFFLFYLLFFFSIFFSYFIFFFLIFFFNFFFFLIFFKLFYTFFFLSSFFIFQ